MKTYPIFFVCTLLLFSCRKNKTTATVDEPVRIKMTEYLDSTKRTLSLYCYTEKVFPCSNYHIRSTYSVSSDKLILNFEEITVPGICLTSIGPASATINAGTLANKNYALEIQVGNTKVSGQMAVTTGNIKVNLPGQTTVQFVNADLNRVPENTIYGTVHYHAAATGTTVQQFIDSLQYLGAVTTTYTAGDFGNFQIEPNGQIRQTQDPGYNFTRYFIFNYSNGSTPLKDLVKRFGTQYPNLLLITLHTTKGETFYSWTP